MWPQDEEMDMNLGVKPIIAWLYGELNNGVGRPLMRAWLRYRLDTYSRCLHTIAAQRENDFHAERMLHRAISATRSRLQSL
jgi:hypothetical protein